MFSKRKRASQTIKRENIYYQGMVYVTHGTNEVEMQKMCE